MSAIRVSFLWLHGSSMEINASIPLTDDQASLLTSHAAIDYMEASLAKALEQSLKLYGFSPRPPSSLPVPRNPQKRGVNK